MSDLDADQLIRLFVSSTFSDFAMERDVLQRMVFPQLRRLCTENGFRFQPIDFRWGVSEQAAQDQRTFPLIANEIRRCQAVSPDLNFLILLGDRYGSRALPTSIPAHDYRILRERLSDEQRTLFDRWYAEDRNASDPEFVLLPRDRPEPVWRHEVGEPLLALLSQSTKSARMPDALRVRYTGSYTHLEIQEGLLNLGDSSAVLAMMRTFSHPGLPRAYAGPYVEGDRNAREELNRLKRSISRQLRNDQMLTYAVPWSDGPSVSEDELAAQFLFFLVPHVRACIARRTRMTRQQGGKIARNLVSLANDRFGEDRTAWFTGRIKELDDIRSYLETPALAPLWVLGPSGSGKSTLLAAAMRQIRMPGVSVVRYIGYTPGTSSISDFLDGLRREILQAYQQKATSVTDEYELKIALKDALHLATRDRPLILMLDAIDQLGVGPQALDWLPRPLPEHVHVVVSSLAERGVPDGEHSSPSVEPMIMLGPLSRDEGENVLNRMLEDAGRRLQANQREALLDGFMHEGRPLYLRLAVDQARRWRSFDPVQKLPSTLRELMSDVFARLEDDGTHGPVLVGHSLGYVAAARNGLAEDEVLDVLARDDNVRADIHRLSPNSPPIDPKLPLPVVLWSQLYAEFQAYFTEHEADGGRLLALYHREMVEVVTQRYLNGGTGTRLHAALSAYFAEQPTIFGTGDAAPSNLRKLSELPYQQDAAGMRDALRLTLTDVGFLERLIKEGTVRRATHELSRLRGDEAVGGILRCVGQGASILDVAPNEVTNQIRGRGGPFEVLHNFPERDGPYFVLRTQSLPRADTDLILLLHGHESPVTSCAFSPDGRRALSASWDRTLRLWDVEIGQEIRVLRGHTNAVTACAFGPDGRHALSASWDQTLRWWDVETGQTVQTMQGHKGFIWGCALSPDGCHALSASMDHTLRLWDVETGREVMVFYGHSGDVMACAFSPNGDRIVSGSQDKSLRLWDVQTGREIRQFNGVFRTFGDRETSLATRFRQRPR